MIGLLFSPEGRLSRSAFWAGQLVILMIALVGAWLFYDQSLSLIWLILTVPLAWTKFCLIVKRWHDRGKSGWWGLIVLIPLLGLIWAVIELVCLSGTPGPNRYGSGPKGNNFFPLSPHVAPDDYHAHFHDDDPT